MGLFEQDIYIKKNDSQLIIEKQTLSDFKKERINLIVEKGYRAVFDSGLIIPEGKFLYSRQALLGGKEGQVNFYLIPMRNDPKKITLYGCAARVPLSLSVQKTAKGIYGVIINVTLTIDDYKSIALYFKDSLKLNDLESRVKQLVEKTLVSEFGNAVRNFISSSPTITADELAGNFNSIINSVMKSASKTNILLSDLGIAMSARDVTLRINPVDVDDVVEKIVDKYNERALDEVDQYKYDREERERDKIRQHEIDIIKAHNTKVNENVNTNNINSNQPVNIENRVDGGSVKSFCPGCGAEIIPGSNFCVKCGRKL